MKNKYDPLKILIEDSIEREFYFKGKEDAIKEGNREIDELEKWVVNKIFNLREKNREYKSSHELWDEIYIKGFEEVLQRIVNGK